MLTTQPVYVFWSVFPLSLSKLCIANAFTLMVVPTFQNIEDLSKKKKEIFVNGPKTGLGKILDKKDKIACKDECACEQLGNES